MGCIAALLEYEVNLDLKNSKGKRALDIAQEGETGDCKRCASYIIKKMGKKIQCLLFYTYIIVFFINFYLHRITFKHLFETLK